MSREHGSQRWKYGFDLQLLMHEWGILCEVLLDRVEAFGRSHMMPAGTLASAIRTVTRYIIAGMKGSVDEYYRRHRMEAVAQLRDLENVIREKDHLDKQRGRALSEVSHDLKGGMTPFLMTLELLKRNDLHGESQKLVNRLSNSAEKLIQLLNSLLDLSRLEAGREQVEPEEFDASELLTDMCEELQSVAHSEGLALQCFTDGPILVYSDLGKVRRIAQNLALNALRYTQEGSVELVCKDLSENKWMIRVRDSGPGLSTTVAFGSVTHPEGAQNQEAGLFSSEGIGLSIVRHLCRLLEAVLIIHSVPGEGTTFEVMLPKIHNNRKEN